MNFRAVSLAFVMCSLPWATIHAQEYPHNPPFPVIPCNMNCLDKGHVRPVPPNTDPVADQGKHRVIVLTDMGADNDDSQSIVRLLLYSNDIDIEGLIATTSTFMMDRTNVWLIEKPVDAYAKVRPNLLKHDSNYPTAAHLRSLIKAGSPLYGMGGVGPGKDSEGSELIISALKRNDPRPLWITVWGGPNVLAQALWKLRSTESPKTLNALVAKLRVYAIGDQDDSGFWMRREFPSLFWITPVISFGGATPIEDSHPEMVSSDWVAKNIQQDHGPMGEVYPDTIYGNEGDTPSFLGLIPNGLNDPSHPSYGGWGGRFVLTNPGTLPTFPSMPNARSQNIVKPIPETRPLWVSAEDQYRGPMMHANFSALLRGAKKRADLPKDTSVPLWRWREDVQNDFAARIEWTTKPYNGANHPPVAVLARNTPQEFTVHSGEEFHLNATGSYDPDHDSLSFYWFQYEEAGDFHELISFAPFSQGLADQPVTAPKVNSPKTIQFILRVTDKGTPPISRYRRVIVHVVP